MKNENAQDAAAKQLLETLADINRVLRDHVVELRRSSVATSAETYLEAIAYTNGPVLEGYVDAKLANGGSACWCLDVRWNHDSWTIDATLTKQSGDRQETIAELPVATVTSLDDFLSTLRRVVGELLALRIPESKVQ